MTKTPQDTGSKLALALHAQASAYAAAQGISLATLCNRALGQSGFASKLASGQGRLVSYERLLDYMAANPLPKPPANIRPLVEQMGLSGQ